MVLPKILVLGRACSILEPPPPLALPLPAVAAVARLPGGGPFTRRTGTGAGAASDGKASSLDGACDEKTYQGYHMFVSATSMPQTDMCTFVPGLPHGAKRVWAGRTAELARGEGCCAAAARLAGLTSVDW